MAKYYACNDALIDQIVSDARYDIRIDGTVWFKTKKNEYRQTGNAKTFKHGKVYRHLMYKNANLLVHRIIFRKFCGKLDASLIINHIDGDSLNNTPKNLELITQRENIIHAHK